MGDITHFLDDVTVSHPFKKRTGTGTWNLALNLESFKSMKTLQEHSNSDYTILVLPKL